jgi:hypothetical protein
MENNRRNLLKLFGATALSTPVLAEVKLKPSPTKEIQALGEQFVLNTGATGLNVDQWAYYYTQYTGEVFSGSDMERILSKLSLDFSTRSRIIALEDFLAAV